jgi:hypothetical protein
MSDLTGRLAAVQVFGASRRAVTAARDVQASAAQALDLYDSMWRAPVAAVTVGLSDIPGLLGTFGIDTAMMVPAFARGMNVITGVGSGLPLVDIDPTTGQQLAPAGLTAQQDPWRGRTWAALWRHTLTDMVARGAAVWLVTERDGFGHPTRVQPIDRDWWHIGEDAWAVPSPPVVWELVGGQWDNPRPATRDDLIIFDTGGPGALDHGWLALRTALSLESAANNYAIAPLPAMALKSAGVDLDATESQELLTAWETARRQRSTAYLNSQVDLETFGWNAAELQLVEARQQAAVEIARVLNLDPYFVGATTGGSSLTYQNRTDLYQSLLDFTIMPLLRVIEQTLSRDPNSAGSRVLRFDTNAFLRSNLTERVAALTAYVAAGIITPEQAAALEPMIRKGDVPQ